MRHFWFPFKLIVLVLMLLAACEGGAEEDVPAGGDEALTADEIYDEAERVAAATESVQVDYIVQRDGQESFGATAIGTREGTYFRQDGGLEGFEEVCAEGEAGAIVEPPNICELDFREMLWLNRTDVYYRGMRSGEWVRPAATGTDSEETGDGETTYFHAEAVGEVSGTLDEGAGWNHLAHDGASLVSSFALFGAEPTSIELGPRVAHGGGQSLLLEFYGEYASDSHRSLEELPAAADDPELDAIRAQIESQLADSPVRSQADVTLVLDEDFRPVRIESVTRGYAADDRLLYTETIDASFSVWNEAELPGPLPAR